MQTTIQGKSGIEDRLAIVTSVLCCKESQLSPPLIAGSLSLANCVVKCVCSQRCDKSDLNKGVDPLGVLEDHPLPLLPLPQPSLYKDLDQLQQEQVFVLLHNTREQRDLNGSKTKTSIKDNDLSVAHVSETPRMHTSSPSFNLMDKCGAGGINAFKLVLDQSKPIMPKLNCNPLQQEQCPSRLPVALVSKAAPTAATASSSSAAAAVAVAAAAATVAVVAAAASTAPQQQHPNLTQMTTIMYI
jgi:hypothetical protein